MKTIKLMIIALGMISMASCQKDEKPTPTPQWDGMNTYRFEFSKSADNAPYGSEGNLLRISQNDSIWWDVEFQETLGQTEVYEFSDSASIDYYIGVALGETSNSDYKKFEVYRNDTLINNLEGSGQLFIPEYFQLNN